MELCWTMHYRYDSSIEWRYHFIVLKSRDQWYVCHDRTFGGSPSLSNGESVNSAIRGCVEIELMRIVLWRLSLNNSVYRRSCSRIGKFISNDRLEFEGSPLWQRRPPRSWSLTGHRKQAPHLYISICDYTELAIKIFEEMWKYFRRSYLCVTLF